MIDALPWWAWSGVIIFAVMCAGVLAAIFCAAAAPTGAEREMCSCGHSRHIHTGAGGCLVRGCRCFIYDRMPRG